MKKLWGLKRDAAKSRLKKSFSKRLVKVWIFGVVIPLLAVGGLILWQSYKENHKEVDKTMKNVLQTVSDNMNNLMDNMNSVSWLLREDGTVGKNLPQYFEDEDMLKKSELLIYMREQIANYEAANSSISNLTYLWAEPGHKDPVKINVSSLADGKLPEEKDYLCKWKDVTFYGPHPSQSKAASYQSLSLLRPYKSDEQYGKVYIYMESGFRYLQTMFPENVMGMHTILLIESDDGRTMYSSDQKLVPLYSKTEHYTKKFSEDKHQYKVYEKKEKGNWKIHLWIPEHEYYRQIYEMAINFGFITILAVLVCILMSFVQWKSIYRPFVKFEKQLQRITMDDDAETKLEQMNIQEFDENFTLLTNMKKNILLLMNKVQAEEKQRSKLEIKEVMGKINPHFLYNTLDTLKWYAAGKSDKEMVHFITSLNKLLLYNMSRSPKATLEGELEAIRAYITLQQLKYDIDFHINTGKHPEVLQAELPRFVLQPLVENAILHSGSDHGKIQIDIELLANGKIAVIVKNVGQPINMEKFHDVLVQKNDSSSNGIGLQYVARMLEDRFGDQFDLRAESMEDGVNMVEIRIPFMADKITDDWIISKGV